MKRISNNTENNPRPNLVGSPKIDCQSPESEKFFNLILKLLNLNGSYYNCMHSISFEALKEFHR